MNLKDLTPGQIERAKACEDVDDLMQLAREEGIELSDEELDGLSGAFKWNCCSDLYLPPLG